MGKKIGFVPKKKNPSVQKRLKTPSLSLSLLFFSIFSEKKSISCPGFIPLALIPLVVSGIPDLDHQPTQSFLRSTTYVSDFVFPRIRFPRISVVLPVPRWPTVQSVNLVFARTTVNLVLDKTHPHVEMWGWDRRVVGSDSDCHESIWVPDGPAHHTKHMFRIL